MDNLIQKSLSNIAKTVKQRFGQANTALGNFYKGFAVTPQKVQNTWNQVSNPVNIIRNTASVLPGGSILGNQAIRPTVDKYIQNRYVEPVKNIIPSAQKLVAPKSTLLQRGEGALGILGGIATIVPDPIQDVGMPIYDLLKGAKAYQVQNQGKKLGLFEAIQKGGLPALTMEKPVGLGEALTQNKTGQTIGNFAELPLVMGLAHSMSAKSKAKLLDEDVKEIGKIANRFSKGWMNNGMADINQMAKDENLIDTILNSKYKASIEELKKIPLDKKINTLFGIAMEDYRGGPNFKKIQPGLSTKPIKGVKQITEQPSTPQGGVPQMMTPVVTGKTRLKVRMKPVEGVPEMKAPKMNIEELNQASGLPPEGLPAQPQQKRNVLSQLYDRFLNESRNKLNQMGQAGQQMSKKIDNMYTEAQRQAGSKVADLTKVINKLDNNAHNTLIQELRGERSGLMNEEVKKVREILNKVYRDAKAVGLDVGYRENYVPQMVDMDKLKANPQGAIDYFIKTKQMTKQGAEGFVMDVINGTDLREAYNRFGKPLPKKMGNLEFQRILDWLPDVLRTDKKLIPDYIEQAYSRIAQIKHFGKNNEIGGNLLSNIQKQGYDVKLAQQIMDQNLGLTRYDRTMQKASGIIRGVQAAMKLSTGAITNATQSVNTATAGGIRRTLGTIYRYATNPIARQEMNDFALRTGATLNGEMKQIMDQWKGNTPLEKLIAPFFGQVENFNRVIAANVGRSKAMASGIVDEQALLKAGQEMVDKTQFQVRPIDLPTTWSSPIGKVATQFKSFGFRQAEFVKKEIVDKAIKGDIKPLARFILAGTLVNEISNNLKSFINRKDRPEDITQRIIEDVPGLGFYQDFVESLAYGIKASSYDKNAIPNAIFDFVAGPTGGDIRKGLANTGQALQGNMKPLAKETVSSIPFIGKPFVNENPQLFGGKAKIKTPSTVLAEGTKEMKQDFVQKPTILDEQKLKDQISELQKQQKAIYDQAGVNVPLIGNFGTMSDQQKIQKMNELEAQILDLKNQQKVMNTSIEIPKAPILTGQTELDKQLISKYKGVLTTEGNDAIELYKAGQITKVEAEKILDQVAAIKKSVTPVKLKAAPKVRKIAVRKVRTSTAKFKVKTPKLTKVKVIKPKKYKIVNLPKLTKIKPLAK